MAEAVVTILPSASGSSGELSARTQVGGFSVATGLEEIRYDHIPVQTLQPAAKVRLIHSEIAIRGKEVAYLPGAGDEVPDALRALGFTVTILEPSDVRLATLKKFHSVVLGIRAFNTNEYLREAHKELIAYANHGGTVVVQYNTSFELKAEKFAPFALTLGRERVTEEDAEVRFLKPEHPVLQSPNLITSADFTGWVQERGLYFAAKWDPAFQAILSSNDTNEPPRDGGLLVAAVGKGHFIYTGLSFFRQLPEGVTGAYRLFANMVSLQSGVNSKTRPKR